MVWRGCATGGCDTLRLFVLRAIRVVGQFVSVEMLDTRSDRPDI